MNILYLITSLDYGGAQKSLLELAKYSVIGGYRVFVVSLKKSGIYEQKFTSAKIPVYSLNLPKFSLQFIFKLPFAIYKLLKLVKDNKIEIIHSFLFQANIIGRLVAKICGLKNISSVRVMELEKKFQWFAEHLTNFMVDRFTVNAQELVEFVIQKEGVPQEKIVYIPNYFNPESFHPSGKNIRDEFGLGKDDFLLCGVGRLERQKGFEYLIDAVSLLKNDIPELKLLLVGDGTLRVALELKIKNLGLAEGMVFLTGARDDVADIIASSNVFVLSSLWEGSPNVLLEAIYLNKPVISTSVSGISNIVDKEYIVPPGDVVELAKKILYVYKNPEAVNISMRNNAKKLAQFTTTENLEKYIQLYKSLVKNGEEDNR